MTTNAKNKLILALDVPDFDEARKLIDELGDAVAIYKVGYQLFVAYGPFLVRYLAAQGKKVFLDLKFHDIPNTVANGVASAVALGVPPHQTDLWTPLFMLTVHTQGGVEMMTAAADAAKKQASELKVARPFLVGVTVLTSDAATDDTSRLVLERARQAKVAGLDGVVCSVQEAAAVRRECGRDFLIVTPGIRPADSDVGDQKRVDTPAGAIKAGASFLVVGRPIVKAKSPKDAAMKILAEMNGV
jgi:orotidine-5'-phosphate decarboxylase